MSNGDSTITPGCIVGDRAERFGDMSVVRVVHAPGDENGSEHDLEAHNQGYDAGDPLCRWFDQNWDLQQDYFKQEEVEFEEGPIDHGSAIEPGTAVRHRGEGPPMTVIRVLQEPGTEEANDTDANAEMEGFEPGDLQCHWTNKNGKRKSYFFKAGEVELEE